MRARDDENPFSLGRFGLVAFLALTIFAAALLSAAPGLHEYLHPETTSTHLCIVTLFASGQCHATTAAPVCVAPAALPFLAILPSAVAALFPGEHFFSLLEHAPPSFA
jgi:hypothetical protein